MAKLISLFLTFFLSVSVIAADEIDISLDGLDTGEREIAQVEEDSDDEMIVAPENELDEDLVVEQEYLAIRTSENIEDVIPEYKDRRTGSGFLISISYSLFSPVNYQPNFSSNTFDEIYGDGSASGLIEATLQWKWNFVLGAIGAGIGVGYYTVESADTVTDATSLAVVPIRLETSLILDNLFSEPYAAPYVVGGAYINYYSEKQESSSFNGTTQVAPYVGAGVNIQLDWLEPNAAVKTYLDYGLENTFLYVEGRKFIASSAAQDPDFETAFQLAGGFKIEY